VVICIVDGSHFACERLMAFTSWHPDAVSGSHPPHLFRAPATDSREAAIATSFDQLFGERQPGGHDLFRALIFPLDAGRFFWRFSELTRSADLKLNQ
jgi:hypothetical protein